MLNLSRPARRTSAALLICTGLLQFAISAHAQGVPVFPGAVGFGIDTPAGRGGQVFNVRNLNAAGPDSLEECLSASGARVCVFEVSGVIELDDELEIHNPYVTLAGQTAPSPGIMLRGAGIEIKGTHDVLIQHIAVRIGGSSSGPDPKDRDGIKIVGSSERIIIDHVSMYWSTDETGSVWAFSPDTRMSDITFSNCIIAEGLNRPVINSSHTSKGLIVGNALGSTQPANVAIVQNLFAHNLERNPFTTSAFIANNVVYNWQFQAIDIRGDYQRFGTAQASVVGNVFLEGADTTISREPILLRELTDNSQIYVLDNDARWIEGEDQWGDLVASTGGTKLSSVRASAAPLWPNGFTAIKSDAVESYVLANVGSRPANRDATDARVVNDVRDGTGQLKSCVENCVAGDTPVPGGWPRLAENFRVLTVPNDPNGDEDRDGYTNLEEWLHGYSEDVEGRASDRQTEVPRPNPPEMK